MDSRHWALLPLLFFRINQHRFPCSHPHRHLRRLRALSSAAKHALSKQRSCPHSNSCTTSSEDTVERMKAKNFARSMRFSFLRGIRPREEPAIPRPVFSLVSSGGGTKPRANQTPTR
ncbi:hypothetical protein NXC24_PC01970 (plasmid) [Rhizobium sp. NXC24]|nr:hypothetical protein NXC24_PC01970 [Rhizobium sp. NXC24]